MLGSRPFSSIGNLLLQVRNACRFLLNWLLNLLLNYVEVFLVIEYESGWFDLVWHHLAVCIPAKTLILVFNKEVCGVDAVDEVVCRVECGQQLLLLVSIFDHWLPVWELTRIVKLLMLLGFLLFQISGS